MKVMVFGAGGQGAPCASILSVDGAVEEIKLCDLDGEMLCKVAAKINSPKLTTQIVDASDEDAVAEAARGYDALIDLVTPAFFECVMRGTLKAGCHYVNTAWEEYLYKNFERDDVKIGDTLKYSEEYKQKGLTAILGCGMTSGYASNVLARYYVDRLDSVKSIKFRLAKKNLDVPEEEEILHAWNPGWNPRQALLDFVVPTYKFDSGEFVKMEQPFAEPEVWEFPAPIGKQLVSHHAHEEPFNIPQSFVDKGLEYCDFKYYVNKTIAPIVMLGLGSEQEIDIKGAKVRPIDVVLKFVPPPGDSFLNEDPTTFAELDRKSIVSIVIEIIGTQGGRGIRYMIHIPNMCTPRQYYYDVYGTSYINVALPAAVGAKMAVEGTAKGVINPQALDPKRFLDLMEQSGFKHNWEETLEYI